MNDQIFDIKAQRFIYGKLLETPRATYDIVARSPSLSDADARRIYSQGWFNDCRPMAPEIPNFLERFVVRPIPNEKLVILHLYRSSEKETGRGFFLEEDYTIISFSELHIVNFAFLLSLTSVRPELSATSFDTLRDSLQVSNSRYFLAVKDALTALQTDNLHRTSIIWAINKTLSYGKVKIPDVSDNQWLNWMLGFGLLLPFALHRTINIRIDSSIGGAKSIECELQLASSRLSRQQSPIVFDSHVDVSLRDTAISYARSYGKLLDDLYQVNTDFLSMVDKIQKIPLFDVSDSSKVEIAAWEAAMPYIGVDSVMASIQSGQVPTEDIMWFWEHAIDRLSPEQQLMVLRNIDLTPDKWWRNRQQYEVYHNTFSFLFDSHRSELLGVLENWIDKSSEGVSMQFILNWVTYVNRLTKPEAEIIEGYLARWVNAYPEKVLEILMRLQSVGTDLGITQFAFRIKRVQPAWHNAANLDVTSPVYVDLLRTFVNLIQDDSHLQPAFEAIVTLSDLPIFEEFARFLECLIEKTNVCGDILKSAFNAWKSNGHNPTDEFLTLLLRLHEYDYLAQLIKVLQPGDIKHLLSAAPEVQDSSISEFGVYIEAYLDAPTKEYLLSVESIYAYFVVSSIYKVGTYQRKQICIKMFVKDPDIFARIDEYAGAGTIEFDVSDFIPLDFGNRDLPYTNVEKIEAISRYLIKYCHITHLFSPLLVSLHELVLETAQIDDELEEIWAELLICLSCFSKWDAYALISSRCINYALSKSDCTRAFEEIIRPFTWIGRLDIFAEIASRIIHGLDYEQKKQLTAWLKSQRHGPFSIDNSKRIVAFLKEHWIGEMLNFTAEKDSLNQWYLVCSDANS